MVLGAAPADSATGPDCSSSESASTPLADFSADAQPVVLVPGWNGSGDDMAPVADALADLPVSTFLFDYYDHREDWAADRAVSGCLAEYVDAVSAGHVDAGGDGKVIVVGHSTGGLATRFASDSAYATDPIDDVLGGVVTIATPHLGSPFGDTDLAMTAGEVLGDDPDDPLFIPPPGSDAAVCLAEHSPPDNALPDGCDVAPYLPADTPLSQPGGSVYVRRTLLGVPLYTIPLAGDGVVPLKSSHGYADSGPGGRAPQRSPGSPPIEQPTVSCEVDLDQVAEVAASQGFLEGGAQAGLAEFAADVRPGALSRAAAPDDPQANQLDPPAVALLAAANLVAPCSHSGMLTDKHSLVGVREAVARDIGLLGGHSSKFTVLTGSTAGFGEFRDRGGRAVPDLVEAFGEPDSTTPRGRYSCKLSWDDIGAVVTIGIFGETTGDPCEEGIFLSAELTDPRWRTDTGIGPGSSAAEAEALATKDCTDVTGFTGGCVGADGYTFGLHRTECAAQESPNVTAQTDGTEPVRSLTVYWHGCE